MGNIGIAELFVIFFVVVVFAVIHVIPCWHILRKAGYKPAWSLLAIIPVMLTIGLYVVAFSKWPNESKSTD